MSTPARLSDKLYRWTKPDGGHCIGRVVEQTQTITSDPIGVVDLVRSDFGELYWVDARELIEHDAGYRAKEKEAGQ